MRATQVLFIALAAWAAPAHGLRYGSSSASAANPIRKVVNLLQDMVKKVTAEGVREEELYHKFMCYCETGTDDLKKSIADANVKIPELQSDIEAGEAKKSQLEKDVDSHQQDRAAAEKAMADATSVRGKEKTVYDKEHSDLTTNIAALGGAISAIEKGMGGSFLQSSTAQVVRKILQARADSMDADKQELLAFLSGSQVDGYAPQSGEILGILKTMHDEMSVDLKDTIAAEDKAIEEYKGLIAAKKKEVAALSAMIEDKLGRIADLGVKVQAQKNDLTDTEEALVQDTKFLAELASSCKTKTGEYEANKKVRAEELLALADTIKILNDDDALELFKKTLPSASSSFVEIRVSSSTVQARALSIIDEARRQERRPQLDFIAMALHGKKIGFDKVIKMIDDLVAELEQEQIDDDKKKEYCNNQFDQLDDSKKALERKVSDLETAIADAKEGIETLNSEIKALQTAIAALDKSVAEATEQRKEEHAEYKELMANDAAAKEVLAFAKNRLNKFYNPKMYKAPPKEEVSRMDRIASNMEFFQVAARKDAPPPPPETFGAYTKKSEENNGVIAMIDLLVQDLDKEMAEAETTEKDAQADYEKLMADAASKRAEDSKSLADRESALADLQAALEQHTDEKASTQKELAATNQYIFALHQECDWLLKYFDVRKDARASEVDALGKAKAVLSGADYA